MSEPLIVLGGATASGKSALALELARRLDGEIINADSQQVYRGMDVGTGKPSAAEQREVRHLLYDVADPWEQLDASRFMALADAAVADVRSRGRRVIVVGGTGLWIRTLLRGLVDAPSRDDALRARLEAEAAQHGLAPLYERLRRVDPERAAFVGPEDPVRIIRALEVFELGGVPLSELLRRHALGAPRYEAVQLALEWSVPELDGRIHARARSMFETGLVEETKRLLEEPRARPRLERVMGYREALALLEGRMGPDEAVERTFRAQRQYAKRQRNWFRGESQWQWLRPRSALETALSLVSGAR